MRKRAWQAGLVLCAIIASAALWARQNAAGSANASAAQIEQHVEAFLRAYYAWGSAFQIKADAPQPSPVPDLYQVPVQVSYKGQSDKAIVYVTHDGQYILRGTIDHLTGNPYAGNLEKLDVADRPHVGPAKACVNVVEFSDFECPHCREAHLGLEQIEPKNPQVRFTFLDFPLTQVHPWAMTAALAGRCAYAENPAAYDTFRKSIFDNQDQINPDNAFNKLVGLATQAGLDGPTFAACMSSPETKKLVDADMALGARLNVTSTPTFFVNGRPLVGWNTQVIEQFISYEQQKCQTNQ